MNGGNETKNRKMVVTSTTTWTVSKEGQEIHLTPQDLQQLLSQLASTGDLVVFDQGGRRCWSGGQIAVGQDDGAVQIALTENDKPQSASKEVPATETEEAELEKNVLSLLAKKTATLRYLRDRFGLSRKREREILDMVLANLRAEGMVDVSHGRFRLRKAPLLNTSAPRPADIDDETFLAELDAMG